MVLFRFSKIVQLLFLFFCFVSLFLTLDIAVLKGFQTFYETRFLLLFWVVLYLLFYFLLSCSDFQARIPTSNSECLKELMSGFGSLSIKN